MGYGKDLLDRAAAKAGSRYALSKLTGIAESNLSRATHGTRDIPASWVLPLARVAEVDPTEALEMWDLERAEKKRLRRQSLRLALGGGVVIWLTSVSTSAGWAVLHVPKMTVLALRTVDALRIVFSRTVMRFIDRRARTRQLQGLRACRA